jgi:hypothetical protein
LGLITVSDFPDIAAQWLAADLVDSQGVRELAGLSSSDISALDSALMDVRLELNLSVPNDLAFRDAAVRSWISGQWRRTGDMRAAVATLARLDREDGFDFGEFLWLDEELSGGMGRTIVEVEVDARLALDSLDE